MKHIYFIAFCVLLMACSKESDCPVSLGKIVTEERMLPAFHSLSIHGDVEIILGQDSIQSVQLECGENLANSIHTEVIDGELVIDNELKCNWIRDLSTPILLYINTPNIDFIYTEGQKDIRTEEIFTTEFFQLTCEGSQSQIDLELNCPELNIIQSASNCRISLSGEGSHFFVYNSGNGSIDASEFFCEDGFMNNLSIAPIEVLASDFLKARIYSRGDILYFQEPDSLFFELIHPGSGQLIPQ